jgi:PSP1 C-terminal conserved region
VQLRDYLLNYGSAGDFGPFHSEEPLACRRGDRVVVRSHRGQELGVVLRPATEEHARLLEGKFVGQILRLATPGDVALALRMQARSQSLFQDARQLLGQLQLPMELLDAEVLLDGRQAVLHYLRWQECDPRPLMEPLSQKYRLLVTLHDLALNAPEIGSQKETEGCGLPGCGAASGGCGSCNSGGCGTCANHVKQVAVASAASVAATHSERVELL